MWQQGGGGVVQYKERKFLVAKVLLSEHQIHPNMFDTCF